jgi:uncharacterized protein YdeI (BOF family)
MNPLRLIVPLTGSLAAVAAFSFASLQRLDQSQEAAEPHLQSERRVEEQTARVSGQQGYTSIKDVLQNPAYDRKATVKGTIQAVPDENEYIIADRTGRVLVDIWPLYTGDLGLPVGETLVVSGEVDLEDGRVEIDARQITTAGNETISVPDQD